MKKNACLFLTGACNCRCLFCYSPSYYIPKNKQSSPFAELKYFIDILIELGTSTFVLTGGEPLLFKNIFDLVRYIKQRDCEVHLNTNAICLNKNSSKIILEHVDVLGLPIESLNDEINKKLGRYESFIKVMEFLNDYNAGSYFESIKIKIGTVATKINIDNICEIGTVLPENVFLWKIYQFCERGKGVVNKNFLSVEDDKFSKLQTALKNKYPYFRITCATSESINYSNFVVLPSGDVFLPNEDGYLSIGDIRNNKTQKNIVNFWKTEKYFNNASRTYN